MKIQQKVRTSSRKRKLGQVEAVRCAIYARCASDDQSAASIKEQIRRCEKYAKRNGWKIVKEFVKPDIAVSGTAINWRTALLDLMKTAAQRPRLFDRVLIEDTSRFSRNLADTLRLLGHFESNGIQINSVNGELDLSEGSARQLLALQALMDEQYLTALREKIQQSGTSMQGRKS